MKIVNQFTLFENLWIEHGGVVALLFGDEPMLGKIVNGFFIHIRPVKLSNKIWATHGNKDAPSYTSLDKVDAYTDFRMATKEECDEARIKFVPPPVFWKPITDEVRDECLVCKYGDDEFSDFETVLFTDDGSFIYQGETFGSASDCGLTHYVLLSDLKGDSNAD